MEIIPKKITSQLDLKQRVAELELIKDKQEKVLNQNIREVYETLQPAELLKKAISNLREDAESGHESTVNAGIDLLTEKVFNKEKSIGGMLKSVVIGEVLKTLYIKNQDKIHDFIENTTTKTIDFFDAQLHSKASDEQKE